MFAGLVCPEPAVSAGERVKWEDCLKRRCTNCMPYPVRQAIFDSIKERDRWVSPSTLGGCLRKAKWQLTYDYHLQPIYAYWFMRGALIHEILQGAVGDGRGLKEYVISRQIDGTNTELKGQIDYFIDGILYDYKTLVDTGFNYFKKTHMAKDAHIEQANIYRWMMMPKYDVKTIKIIYIGMGTWCVTGEKIIINKWGKKEVYDMDPCPIWTPEKTYDLIKTKIDIIERMENPPADASERWLCQICPFQEKCHSLIES